MYANLSLTLARAALGVKCTGAEIRRRRGLGEGEEKGRRRGGEEPEERLAEEERKKLGGRGGGSRIFGGRGGGGSRIFGEVEERVFTVQLQWHKTQKEFHNYAC